MQQQQQQAQQAAQQQRLAAGDPNATQIQPQRKSRKYRKIHSFCLSQL